MLKLAVNITTNWRVKNDTVMWRTDSAVSAIIQLCLTEHAVKSTKQMRI